MEEHIQKQIKQVWANKKSGHDFQIKAGICDYDLAKTEDGEYHLVSRSGRATPLQKVIGKGDEEIKAALSDIEQKTPTPEIAAAQRDIAASWSAEITTTTDYDSPKNITENDAIAYFHQEHLIMKAIVIDQLRDEDMRTGKHNSHNIEPPLEDTPMTDEQRGIWQRSIEQRKAFNMAENPHNQRVQDMGSPTPSPLKIADPATAIDQNTLRGNKDKITDTLFIIRHNLREDFFTKDDAGALRDEPAPKNARDREQTKQQERSGPAPHPDDAGAVLDEPAPKKRERGREKGIDID